MAKRTRAATEPILVRDPDHPETIPDAALAAMVRQRLRKNEMVYHWNELKRGEFSVLLINGAMNRLCDEIAAQCDPTGRLGREGGCGRTFSYHHDGTAWVFAGEGDWIS